ncbi:hypothetical protein BDZ97DRAFT_1824241 [Flammula alnicola]|nr:hypothetical protein BDZ97DRAFT_1824241 [Flammula alnicola]
MRLESVAFRSVSACQWFPNVSMSLVYIDNENQISSTRIFATSSIRDDYMGVAGLLQLIVLSGSFDAH